jgi:hypothetical protein
MKALVLLFLLLPALVRAQAPAACSCARNLAETQRLLATNYAGYRDKVTAATKPRLDSLLAALQPQADTARAGSCYKVLQQYMRFFKDMHVQLADNKPVQLNKDSIRAQYAGTERLPWTRATFRAYLDDPARPKKPLEGIWRDSGGPDYVVGIVAAKDGRYQGFVLKADSLFWLPGQVKFSFDDPAAGPATARYFMRNHSLEQRPVQLVRDGELVINGSWYRTYPRPVAGPAATAGPLSFRMLDDTTALYRIASFDGDLRLKIDSLTKANAANLARTRLLILDVRGNGGGSDASYGSLVPYLYTNPVVEVSTALYSTPDNNIRYANALFPGMTASEKRYYAKLKKRLDAHLGQFVPMSTHGQTYTVRRKRRQLHPALTRVAVLQNRYCASTTEQFLLLARQSKKTTTFGENSGGVLDYSNVQYQPLPCYNLRLGWSTSRSFRMARGEGIDNVGLAPTVALDPAAPDLVEQVRAWYRQRR